MIFQFKWHNDNEHSSQYQQLLKVYLLIALTIQETKKRVRIQDNISKPIVVLNGIMQGDALACFFLNYIALKRVVRDAGINIEGNILKKSEQAYVDDTGIITRALADLKKGYFYCIRLVRFEEIPFKKCPHLAIKVIISINELEV